MSKYINDCKKEDFINYLSKYIENNKKRHQVIKTEKEMVQKALLMAENMDHHEFREFAALMLYYGSPLSPDKICELRANEIAALKIKPEIKVLLEAITANLQTENSPLFQSLKNESNITSDSIFKNISKYPNSDLEKSLGFFCPVTSKKDFSMLPTPLRIDADPRYTGKGVTIAFIDSGFYPHPDLVKPYKRILAYKNIGDPEAHKSDFEKPDVHSWHGMQTSVAACGNGYLSNGAYRGVAWNANLALIKARGRKTTPAVSIARSIEWCIKKKDIYNIKIINISLGLDTQIAYRDSIINAAAEDAVQAGINIVVAVGNNPNDPIGPPASAPSVITVGGLNDMNSLSFDDYEMYWSTYGQTVDGIWKPEVIAPGILVAAPILPGTDLYELAQALWKAKTVKLGEKRDLLSPFIGKMGVTQEMIDSDEDQLNDLVKKFIAGQKIIHPHYQHVDGTSFSAPIVGSVVAQMLEINPKLKPVEVKEILMKTALPLPGFPKEKQGFGIVQPRAAVECAKTGTSLSGRKWFTAPLVKDNVVSFLYRNPKAKTVALAGSFNNWDPERGEMEMDEQGNWFKTVKFPFPGAYTYKFVVNGNWINDPDNYAKEQDGCGGYNSIFRVFASADTAEIIAASEKLLNDNPPCKNNFKTRKKAFKKIDSVLKPQNIARSDSVKDFFIRRIERGILKLSAMDLIKGSLIMSVYNSGMIVKTPELVIGLDVVSTRHVWGMNWEIPDELLKKMINLIDVLFITHRNPDHFDYDIAKGMLKMGKMVVVPESIADLLPRGALAYKPGEKHDLYSSAGKSMGLKVETFDAKKFVRGEDSSDLLIYRLIDNDGTSLVFTGDSDYTDSTILKAAKTWISPSRPGDEAVDKTFKIISDKKEFDKKESDKKDNLKDEKDGLKNVFKVENKDKNKDKSEDKSEKENVDEQKEFPSRFGVDILMVKGGSVTKEFSAEESISKIIKLARPRYIFPVHVQEIGRSVKLGRDTYSDVIAVMKKMNVSFQMLAWGEIYTTSQAEIATRSKRGNNE